MVNPGLMIRRACEVCGMEMRACNLARHKRYRHDPTYVRPSRTKEYRATHRGTYYGKMERLRQREVEMSKVRTLYIVHLSRKIADHAQHYMGSTENLQARLKDHMAGRGSAMLAWARAEGISFALTYAAAGSRNDERYIKDNRKLAELCSICRPFALAKRAAQAREYRKVHHADTSQSR